MSLLDRRTPVSIRVSALHTGWLALALLLFALATVVWAIGSRNPYTPAGNVGYLTKGAVFGQSRFYGNQTMTLVIRGLAVDQIPIQV